MFPAQIKKQISCLYPLNSYYLYLIIPIKFFFKKQQSTTRNPVTPKFESPTFCSVPRLNHQGPQVEYSPELSCCPRPVRHSDNVSPPSSVLIANVPYLLLFL